MSLLLPVILNSHFFVVESVYLVLKWENFNLQRTRQVQLIHWHALLVLLSLCLEFTLRFLWQLLVSTWLLILLLLLLSWRMQRRLTHQRILRQKSRVHTWHERYRWASWWVLILHLLELRLRLLLLLESLVVMRPLIVFLSFLLLFVLLLLIRLLFLLTHLLIRLYYELFILLFFELPLLLSSLILGKVPVLLLIKLTEIRIQGHRGTLLHHLEKHIMLISREFIRVFLKLLHHLSLRKRIRWNIISLLFLLFFLFFFLFFLILFSLSLFLLLFFFLFKFFLPVLLLNKFFLNHVRLMLLLIFQLFQELKNIFVFLPCSYIFRSFFLFVQDIYVSIVLN